MLKIKHILFPMDFSELCGATAPYVASLARHFGAKITLLNAVQPFWYAPLGESTPVAVDVTKIMQSMELDLSQSFTDQFAGLTTENAVEVGDPAEIITRFAEDHDVDLIMMPTRGHGPFRQFLLGSVTAKVLHDSGKPVWTGGHVDQSPRLLHLDVRTVLCAVDVAPQDADVLKTADELARNVGAKLRLVHVIPAPTAWPERRFDGSFELALMEEARRTIGETQKSLGIDAPLCVKRGDVATSVREAAEQLGADLVVIGRGVLQERMGRLRSNAYAIIRQSPCPVLSF